MEKKNDRVRFTLEFAPESHELLERLAGKLGATKVEFIRRAINLMERAIESDEAGEKLLIERKDGSRERMVFI